ncbi:MAG TPA: hypothetical protein VGQ65_16735 [Thermoanaerobaculia bacterium]|jgi:hypothetical protein|nr:hypothetical protein [Thermoanaerobaculia bacterium]
MRLQLFLMAMILAACHTDVPMASSASELPRISVTSDGGITGRGVGGIVVDGSQVTATLAQKSCSGALTDSERSQLSKLIPIHDSNAEGHGHPDQIRYTLTAGDRTATWYGEEDAPKEVAPLFQLLWQIRQRVMANC